jgi:uncharacterized membrane protein
VNDPADPRRSIDIDLEYLRHRLHPRGHTLRYRWDPAYAASRLTNTPDRSTLRVSDAERNEVADRLSRHFADGRLDEVEFKERLDAAMSAKTQADLAGLFDDLPRLATGQPVPPPRRRRLVPFLAILAIVAVLAGDSVSYGLGWHGYMPHFGWLIPVAIVVFIWTRLGLGHRHHHDHDHDHVAFDR